MSEPCSGGAGADPMPPAPVADPTYSEWRVPLRWICLGCGRSFIFDPTPRVYAMACPLCERVNSILDPERPLARAFEFRPDEPLPEAIFGAIWERAKGRDAASFLAREAFLPPDAHVEIRLVPPGAAMVDTSLQRRFSPAVAWVTLSMPSADDSDRLPMLTARIPQPGDLNIIAEGFGEAPAPRRVCWDLASAREARHTVRTAYGRIDPALLKCAVATGCETYIDAEALACIGRQTASAIPFIAVRRDGGVLRAIVPWGADPEAADAAIAICRSRFPEAKRIERFAGNPAFIREVIAYAT